MLAGLFKSKLFLSVISIVIFCLYTVKVYDYGKDVGAKDLILKYTQETKEKEDEILQLKSDLAVARQDAITLNEELGAKYEEKLYEQEEAYRRSIDDLESDNIRLRVNLGKRDTPETGTPPATKTESCDDDRGEAYLPKDTSRLLIGQANRADRVVQKLTACQETVRLYLELTDRYNRLITGDKDATKRIQLDD